MGGAAASTREGQPPFSERRERDMQGVTEIRAGLLPETWDIGWVTG
jgi:hypothetical protein